ncbi:MAG: beta-lactamase family protein [Blastocatellia bacterium]|nr:beta-lactamase family protein [Blastocatellia bacterium]
MKTFGIIAIVLMMPIATLLSASSSHNSSQLSQFEQRAAAQPGCSYDFSAVNDLLQEAVKTLPLNGASLMLIKDDQQIYEQYFGNYNAGTTVFIASASKWLAGATMMTLVDENKLSLDDKVSQYLPYFEGPKGAMTIRQMFSHTSGLPGIPNDANCISNRFVTMGFCARQISRLELIGPPGAQFSYGENSMQVAGRICEIVSGKSWESLFQEKIAGPLRMEGTTFGRGDNPMVAGGARSQLHDYANFLQMILNEGKFKGVRVLSAKSVNEMQRNLTAGLPVIFSPSGQDQVNYATGEWIEVLDEHGDAVQLSSPGALGFTPWVDKKRNMVGVFLVQIRRQRVAPTIAAVRQKINEAVDACAGSGSE